MHADALLTNVALATLAAKIAAQLARERAAQAATVHQIADDAVKVATLAGSLRSAVMLGTSRSAFVATRQLQATVAPYEARVVRADDPAGMVVGLRLSSGAYTSGFQNIFFLA